MLNSYLVSDLLKQADDNIIQKKASAKKIEVSDKVVKLAEKLNQAADELDKNIKISSVKSDNISFNEKLAQAINLVDTVNMISDIKPFISFVKEAKNNGYNEDDAINFYKEEMKKSNK